MTYDKFVDDFAFAMYYSYRCFISKSLLSAMFKEELIIDYEMRILTNKIISEEL